MSDIAIHVENLGKQFQYGANIARYKTIRETISEMATAPFKRIGNILKGQAYGASGLEESFWALKDITLDIKRGEVMGIIGRNGAGKSTFLKVLSRITEPTEGFAQVRGRIGSLLEVGTGFHPELTGRDNVYLNGAILGMKREEINRKFDEIVSFAEIEKFIDTPVKHYSSGMYVRLAFAVAAHLDTEILLVDEVLSVGDLEFQNKCLGKIGEVTSGGRTVLFVSHNMDAVQRLCERGIILQNGHLIFDGPAVQACQQYIRGLKSFASIEIGEDYPRQGDGRAKITKLEVIDANTCLPSTHIPSGDTIKIRFHYLTNEPIQFPRIGFALLTIMGARVFNSTQSDSGLVVDEINGQGVVEIEMKDVLLAPGGYMCNLAISDRSGHYCDYLTNLPCFEVQPSQQLSKVRSYDQSSGVIYVNMDWTIHQNEPAY